jgi:hypothetical protein
MPAGYDRSAALPQPVATATGWDVDACATPWATAAGRPLGRLGIIKTASDVARYAVASLTPCP